MDGASERCLIPLFSIIKADRGVGGSPQNLAFYITHAPPDPPFRLRIPPGSPTDPSWIPKKTPNTTLLQTTAARAPEPESIGRHIFLGTQFSATSDRPLFPRMCVVFHRHFKYSFSPRLGCACPARGILWPRVTREGKGLGTGPLRHFAHASSRVVGVEERSLHYPSFHSQHPTPSAALLFLQQN